MSMGSKAHLAAEVKKFGLGFGLGMGILTAIALWREWPQPLWITTLILSLYHLSLFQVATGPLLPSFYLVTTVGKILGHGIFTVIFTLVYYSLYTPISWILRLAGKDHITPVSGWKDYPSQANDPKRIEKLY